MVPDLVLQNLIKHADDNDNYQRVVDVVKWGVHIKKLHKAHPAQKYLSLWEEMAVYEGDQLLIQINRIIAPAAVRKAILASIHIQHTGQTKTLENEGQQGLIRSTSTEGNTYGTVGSYAPHMDASTILT